MEKRAVIFLVLSLTILYLYSYLGFQREDQRLAGIQTAPPAEQSSRPPSEDLPPRPPDSPGILDDPAERFETRQSVQEVVVETDLYRAVLTSRGGAIKYWELKQYREETDPESPRIVLFDADRDSPEIYPLDLWVEDESREIQDYFQKGFYELEGDDIRLRGPDAHEELRWTARGPSGRRVTKQFTFFSDRYDVDVRIETDELENGYTLYGGTNFSILDWNPMTFVAFVGPTTLIQDEVIKDKPDKMPAEVVHSGLPTWTALQETYFVSALVPLDGEGAAVARKLGEQEVTVGIRHLSTDREQANSFRLYAGPKEYDRLRAYKLHLEEMIDFGWFIYGSWALVRMIAQPLFSVLRFFHDLTGNYGIAIILLTILIKLVFSPLTHKSYVSMKGMQEIQPEIKALQKKYKDDKPKLQQELMAVYKQHKVNPLGGCLPVFLQIPFFIALFNILYTTIELRHAPFMFWIHDLSDKDPYFVLPIIMGISMLVMQKLQPTALDPRQAKIMMFLPIIFTYFFLFFPSGLVLYWIMNNILSTLQQYLTRQYLLRKEQAQAQT